MPNTPDTTWTCPTCLSGARLATDKRGGRYLACGGCGSRTFLKGTTIFGLELLRVVVAVLGPRRLQERLGSDVVLAALGEVLYAARRHLGPAIEKHMNTRAWDDLLDQIDEVLPDAEQNGQPER